MEKFIVRRRWSDSKSETIAKASNYNRAYDNAVTFLQENERDYEAFDMVRVDSRGRVLEVMDTVSWEPRG